MKTRFAPSPTGYIHLGNTRTALFNYLLTKSQQAAFLLRIEDTDLERSKLSYVKQLQIDMAWLGLLWNEGEVLRYENHDLGGGSCGPYQQSVRQSIYDQYYQQLLDDGLAYHCFCSAERLDLMRKIQRSSGQPPRYDRTCYHLSKDACQKKIDAGEPAVLRFFVNDEKQLSFDDLVRGTQRFEGKDIGDFIIRRSDGTSPFMFCSSIDDALMGVTHVLRGEDHLTNTPRQLAILQALNLPCPQYGHTALILGQDGSPLSKRNGSRNVMQLKEEGYLPLAIVNYLSRLGHHYANNDLMTMEELSAHFSVDQLGHAAARFDESQLRYYQKEAVMKMSIQDCWQWVEKDISYQLSSKQQEQFIKVIQANILFPQDAQHWAQQVFVERLQYSAEAETVIQAAPVEIFVAALDVLEESGAQVCDDSFKGITAVVKEKVGVKGKALFMPLRAAISGEIAGPQMADFVALLTLDQLKRRIRTAIEMSQLA